MDKNLFIIYLIVFAVIIVASIAWFFIERKNLFFNEPSRPTGGKRQSGSKEQSGIEVSEGLLIYEKAYGSLDRYINSNFSQNRIIFWATIVFVSMGFILVTLGIGFGIFKDDSQLSNLTIIAGVVTEFLATTIFYIYKSINQQTGRYFETLERLVSVDQVIHMVKNLSSTPDENKELNTLKVGIAETLIQSQYSMPQKKD